MQQWNRAPSGTQLVFQDFYASCYSVPIECGPNEELVIAGEFPHARYISFTVICASGDVLAIVYDRELVPDEGSLNPFLPGGAWDTVQRSYTLIISFSSPPGSGLFTPRAGRNTLYVGPLEKPGGSVITYRIGSPGAGYDETGGVGLPEISSRTGISPQASETAVRGAVEAVREQDSGLRGAVYPRELYRHRKSDIEWVRTGRFLPRPLRADSDFVDMISSPLDCHPEKLLCLHWKAPKVPDTWHDLGLTGSEELRCWSMSFVTADGDFVLKIIRDFETMIDQFGYINLVAGFGAARPVFVTPSNGFTWVNLSGLPPVPVSILFRSILISPSFQYAANAVPIGSLVPQGLMGAYYPVGNYISLSAKDQAVI